MTMPALRWDRGPLSTSIRDTPVADLITVLAAGRDIPVTIGIGVVAVSPSSARSKIPISGSSPVGSYPVSSRTGARLGLGPQVSSRRVLLSPRGNCRTAPSRFRR